MGRQGHQSLRAWLEVGFGTLEGHEWGCKITKVIPVGRTYKVSGKCGGEGMRSDQEMTVWLDGRSIFYRLDRSSNELPDLATLTCRDHRSDPSDDDTDPVVITMLTFADAFRVAHTTRFGKTYVRTDQYRDVQTSMVGDDIVTWSGTWKRDPKKRMVGTLSYNGPDYRYTEKTYDRNRLEVTVTSTCTRADGG
jgi:hypothetical protein